MDKPIIVNFEGFLIDKHADQYTGLDDDMPDDFNDWIENLDADDFIRYANQYCQKMLVRQLDLHTEIVKVCCA